MASTTATGNPGSISNRKSARSRLTEELEAEIVERQAEDSERRVVLTRTLAKLADERGKLLQAFYANAIPLDLLKAEQDRIGVAEQAAKGELEATEGTSTAGRTFSKRLSASPAIATQRT